MSYGVAMVDVAHPDYHRGRAPKSKGKTYPVEILTPDEVRTLLLACSATSSIGLRNRALLTMLYRTGIRISEALTLHVKDLDLDRGMVAILRGKGNRRRTVGIDPGAVWIIEAWIERRTALGLPNDAPLFCTLRGRTMRSSLVHSFLPRLARKVGIEKRVHPHGFRHTHAYELMMEGVPMVIIQQQLGHKSLATTNTYLSHIAPKDVIETMGRREWSPD